MDSDSGDLLLKMVLNGKAIQGASQTVLDTTNSLAIGFAAGSLIEIDNFSLRLGTSGLEPGETVQQAKQVIEHPTNSKTDEEKRESISTLSRKGGYQAWRATGKAPGPSKLPNGELGKGGYPLDIQPITFEKPADISSKALIDCCIACASFDSATIIKRKPIGSQAAGEVYLRLDFYGVLVIKVDWADEDEYIKETVSFIARGVTMSYREQTASGSLKPVVSGFWSMVPKATQPPLS